MATPNHDRRLLRELLATARSSGGLTTTAFEWPRLHQLGRSLGLDSSTTEAVVARLQEAGALRNKASAWRVASAHFMLTDAGIQTSLRLDQTGE